MIQINLTGFLQGSEVHKNCKKKWFELFIVFQEKSPTTESYREQESLEENF